MPQQPHEQLFSPQSSMRLQQLSPRVSLQQQPHGLPPHAGSYASPGGTFGGFQHHHQLLGAGEAQARDAGACASSGACSPQDRSPSPPWAGATSGQRGGASVSAGPPGTQQRRAEALAGRLGSLGLQTPTAASSPPFGTQDTLQVCSYG